MKTKPRTQVRFLFYGTSRTTGALAKHRSTAPADTPEARDHATRRAREQLLNCRLISVTRMPFDA